MTEHTHITMLHGHQPVASYMHWYGQSATEHLSTTCQEGRHQTLTYSAVIQTQRFSNQNFT